MQVPGAQGQDRFTVPGIGPSAMPSRRVRAEEIPYGSDRPFPAEAARALAADLARETDAEVRFDSEGRALYATDASNYRQVPIGVVVPRSVEDVIAAVAICRRHGAPVLSRGGGTSLAGECCNVAVVIDFSKHLRAIRALDPHRRVARIEPGIVLDTLRDAAERFHLTFGPDPATHNHNTLGGMLGNDSCGVHSMMAGRTADNVERLRILTYDGLDAWVGPTDAAALAAAERQGGRLGGILRACADLRDRYADLIRARYPHIPRRVSGYNLDNLLPENGFQVARGLVGSEGTLVVILEAEVRLVESPPGRALVVLGYPDIYAAADHVPEVRRFGPIGLEAMDEMLVEDMKRKHLHEERLHLLPGGKGWLLVEFGGADRDDAVANARKAMDGLGRGSGAPQMKLYEDRDEERVVWKIREAGLGASARVPGERDTWEGWEDSAVPPDKVGPYLRKLHALYEKYGYQGALYGHFGQGCIHTRITFDLATRAGVEKYHHFTMDAADLVVSFGGSLSGEHGDGQSRGELLVRMFGPELVEAFRSYKRIWDPAWKMNPGKVVDPYPNDVNLRLGPGFHEVRPRTWFRYPDDSGSFGRAALRCVGVGECRRESGGVMCPSYRATHEETHSTRGRARMLHEMLVGDPVKGGWQAREVEDALHLCLSCKGCKSDCPMNVDMATYKAEFLAHRYEGKLRPRSAYAFGLVMWWARLAALVPGLVNAVGATPGLSALAKAAAGMAPARRIPRFAPITLRRWFAARGPTPSARVPEDRRAVLFADTFTDFFHPEVGTAAVEVLERAGWAVELPRRRLCCGRPLYDYGMLDRARRMLDRSLDALYPAAMAGRPILFLEPSCAAVFRDEALQLFPDDPRAIAVSRQVEVLSELVDSDPGFPVGRLDRKALLQLHCHHHAVLGEDAEQRVLSRLGLEVERPEEGCCGMAGSFGFEAGDRHEVSVACGERALLPAVRRAPPTELLLADGFSCRTQIEQGTGRRALHLAEALRLAQEPAPVADPGAWARRRRPRSIGLTVARAAAGLAALAFLGGALARRRARW
ncbi:FAD-binding and (Fe-S)-binding domain-containing protein [Anaeromyxobacter oryzae]|uniref:Dimethylmenaquinone methyltransferase n=1 Tax=Anaeromyxobacter oryzae TaxID=2918170 RepID=A0ABM7WYI7_9BACT|nr:FAD-binding and (Fe-S)-binding domain-containing protein [Anaeromyxobacter oryzae]BDG04484.1 dimethylmenaquinone methyltransferase [Anaeromyxobacter oryzae]